MRLAHFYDIIEIKQNIEIDYQYVHKTLCIHLIGLFFPAIYKTDTHFNNYIICIVP